MVPEQFKIALEALKNKRFEYRKKQYTLKEWNYNQANNTYLLNTPEKQFTIQLSNLEAFLDEITQTTPPAKISNEILAIPENLANFIATHNDTAAKLQGYLDESLKKLLGGGGAQFVPQANAIDNHINTYIKIAVTQTDILKEVIKLKQVSKKNMNEEEKHTPESPEIPEG